ncbi:MAG TPA: TIGR02757 family protein [Ignavibacteria bacterium]|nr:TIGR02757 family protein [Ignavibacteria bacterium]
MNKKEKLLKQKLDYHYKYFDYSQISPDPLEFLHRYTDYYDIEISGLLSSVFAYGNVRQINSTLNKLHTIMEGKPYEFVQNYNPKKDDKLFRKIVHRFYSSEDIVSLFNAIHRIYINYGSLKRLFLLYYFSEEEHLKNAIHFYSRNMIDIIADHKEPSRGVVFMFPDPFKGSACKRTNLFLRWMVRKDELDLGLWTEIPTEKLVIPVDTHIARICKELKLTKHKNVSWKMAEEITENLKIFDAKDPVKYDFAICHIGMRKMKF